MSNAPQNITLVDDGTLDTVVEYDCPLCNEHVQYRFETAFMDAWPTGIEDLVVDIWEGQECLLDH